MKIKRLTISGIRGVRLPLTLELDGRSLFLYGANGSGKSSISDALEWFFSNRIAHLSGEETGRGGIDALRNVFLKDGEPSWVELDLSCDKNLTARKTLSQNRKGAWQADWDNDSESFANYLAESEKENLILRHADMTKFVLSTKKDKLTTFSELTGMEKFSKIRETLQKVKNELTRESKTKDFNSRAGRIQAKLLELLGQNAATDEQFVAAVNGLLASLSPGERVSSMAEAEALPGRLARPEDMGQVKLLVFLDDLEKWSAGLTERLNRLLELYASYRAQFVKIAGDLEKLRKLALEKLLSEGAAVLRQKTGEDNICPLCLQEKSSVELLSELTQRLAELKGVREERARLESLKMELKRETEDLLSRLKFFTANLPADEEARGNLPGWLAGLEAGIKKYLEQLGKEPAADVHLPEVSELMADKEAVVKVGQFCREYSQSVRQLRRNDGMFKLQADVRQALNNYMDLRELRGEQKRLDEQLRSLEAACAEFLKIQRGAIERFLDKYSQSIQEYYEYMNPGEQIGDFRLVPVGGDEEMEGVAIAYSFYTKKETAPQKYLSESHLNALGIAFFLAVIRAYNRRNRFVVLDDVVSGFDDEHRQRFAALLAERFSDLQALVFTHEKSWRRMLKGRIPAGNSGWEIAEIRNRRDLGVSLIMEGDEQPPLFPPHISRNAPDSP